MDLKLKADLLLIKRFLSLSTPCPFVLASYHRRLVARFGDETTRHLYRMASHVYNHPMEMWDDQLVIPDKRTLKNDMLRKLIEQLKTRKLTTSSLFTLLNIFGFLLNKTF